MRLWTERISPRGRLSLWRVVLAALVLVLASAGGLSTRAEAQGPQKIETGIDVHFDPTTPPVEPGKICKGQTHKILATPFVKLRNGNHGPWMNDVTYVRVQPPVIGIIVPYLQIIGPTTTKAIFNYKSDKTGHENLEFTAAANEIQYFSDATGAGAGVHYWYQTADNHDKPFKFEVIDCNYKVAFIWSTQFVGLVSSVTSGLMDETRLERQEDGTYKGSGSFVFKITNAVPSCVTDFKDIETLLRITGKVLPNSDELELNFDYGAGKLEATFTCNGGGGGKASGPWDISPFAPRTVKFPQEGGSKSFPINTWFRDETGTLTIIVTREEVSELGVGG
jgi:hypothetical protein